MPDDLDGARHNADESGGGSGPTLHSIVVRYWHGPHGELRGMVINPITQQMFPFTSLAQLHAVIKRVVLDEPEARDGPNGGGAGHEPADW